VVRVCLIFIAILRLNGQSLKVSLVRAMSTCSVCFFATQYCTLACYKPDCIQ